MIKMDHNGLWLLIATLLCFFMQAGFLLLETGLVRSKNSINVAIKNFFDFCISIALFWICGYGLMFGASYYGFLGKENFFFEPSGSSGNIASVSGFFLFQSMFCATSATIISGAIAERVYFRIYTIITIVVSVLVYPVFGHWAWGEGGWLASLGFIDFAGSTVVHAIGGWSALAILLIVGPRTGRFSQAGKIQELGATSLPLAGLGTLILWFGWFGFNGGSALAFNNDIIPIILKTNLAAIFSVIGASITAYILFHRTDPRDLFTGSLSGLVAITACCHCVSVGSSIIIGFTAGIICMLSKTFLETKKLDDAVDAVVTHLVCGIWGTLCVALFGEPELIGTGLSFLNQLSVQALGILVSGVWGFGVVFTFFYVLNKFMRLRVSPLEENKGLNMVEHNISSELYDFYRVLNEDVQEKNNQSKGNYTEIGKLAKEYKNRIERELHEKTVALKSYFTTLNNFLTLTHEGFFSFGKDLKIEQGYSDECSKILSQKNLEGMDVAEALFKNNNNKKQEFKESFELYFAGNIESDVLQKLLDTHIKVNDKEVLIEYRVIEDSKLMCIMTDISERKKLEEKLSHEKETQDKLIKAITNSEYFSYLMKEVDNLFTLFEKLSAVNEPQKFDAKHLKPLFLVVHDFKANLSFFGFEKTTTVAFDLETFLSELEDPVDLDTFKFLTLSIRSHFFKEMEFFKDRLGDKWIKSFAHLSIPTIEVRNLISELKNKYPNDTTIIKKAQSLIEVPAKDIFHKFPLIIEELAINKGKVINPVVIKGGDIDLIVYIFEPLANTLVHIVRNMIAHGIESPEERVEKGKKEQGNIDIAIKKIKDNDKEYIKIYFTDDGRGIDFEKVKSVAKAKGLLKKDNPSESELLNFLFSQEVSTTDKVDEISGRGVGLASVKKEVQNFKGNILVKTKAGLGTIFCIKIPLP